MNPVGLSYAVSPFAFYNNLSSRKMEVPVLPSQSLYAHFTYVQGVSSKEDGISLDRLKIIDTLISQINNQRSKNSHNVQFTDFHLEEQEKVIKKLAQEVFQIHQASNRKFLSFQSQSSYRGLIVDLLM